MVSGADQIGCSTMSVRRQKQVRGTQPRKPTLLVICSIIVVWDFIPDELEKQSVLSGVSQRSAGDFVDMEMGMHRILGIFSLC